VPSRPAARHATSAQRPATGLPQSEAVSKVKSVFRQFDADGSGTISRQELSRLLTKLGSFSPAEINRIMDEVDRNGDGEIQYEEFLDWITAPGASIDIMGGEAVRWDLDEALKPLFKIFDWNDSGTISKAEFHNSYVILQGALRVLPAQDGAPPIAALASCEEERVFSFADTNDDNEISFREFVDWQREAVTHSGLGHTELVQLVQKLASLLESIFLLAKPAQREAADTAVSDPVLGGIMSKLAACSRELWRRNHDRARRNSDSSQVAPEPIPWPPLPEGITTAKLIRKHLHEPVPTLDVESITVRIHGCLPDLAGFQAGAGPPRWLAKVVRTIKYKDKKCQDGLYYYAFEDGEWGQLPMKEDYYSASARLSPELRLYTHLLAEADFGEDLSWSKVQMVMEDAEKVGLLTGEEHLEYNICVEKSMMKALESSTECEAEASDYSLRQSRISQLLPKARFSPLQVMASLTDFGIVPPHPLWAGADAAPRRGP